MTKPGAREMKRGGDAGPRLHGNEKPEESSSPYRVSESGKPRRRCKMVSK